MLLAVTDDDELERLVLAHSPKFQGLLDKSRRPARRPGGEHHATVGGRHEGGDEPAS